MRTGFEGEAAESATGAAACGGQAPSNVEPSTDGDIGTLPAAIADLDQAPASNCISRGAAGVSAATVPRSDVDIGKGPALSDGNCGSVELAAAVRPNGDADLGKAPTSARGGQAPRNVETSVAVLPGDIGSLPAADAGLGQAPASNGVSRGAVDVTELRAGPRRAWSSRTSERATCTALAPPSSAGGSGASVPGGEVDISKAPASSDVSCGSVELKAGLLPNGDVDLGKAPSSSIDLATVGDVGVADLPNARLPSDRLIPETEDVAAAVLPSCDVHRDGVDFAAATLDHGDAARMGEVPDALGAAVRPAAARLGLALLQGTLPGESGIGSLLLRPKLGLSARDCGELGGDATCCPGKLRCSMAGSVGRSQIGRAHV